MPILDKKEADVEERYPACTGGRLSTAARAPMD